MIDDDGLNFRQRKFVHYYLESGNAAQSYKKAGYEPCNRNTLDAEASRLTRNAKVAKWIKKRQEQIEKASEVTIEAKRLAAWQAIQIGLGNIERGNEVDLKAVAANLAELNRMDGHDGRTKSRVINGSLDDQPAFEIELLPDDVTILQDDDE